MSSEIENIINNLLSEEQDIVGVAIVNKSGELLMQTNNWDLRGHMDEINKLLQTKVGLGEKGVGSITIHGIKYMIVENTEERKIGTNVTGKGHLIIAPIPPGGHGALICFVNPQVGPRDVLFSVQECAQKLNDLI